jgi:hypothetical protein
VWAAAHILAAPQAVLRPAALHPLGQPQLLHQLTTVSPQTLETP